MNINAKILRLKTVTGIDVAPDIYEGTADKWITFSYTDERGDLFGDDEELVTVASIQIVLNAPMSFNYLSTKEVIKKHLYVEGFNDIVIHSNITDEFIGTERIRRVIFECEYKEQYKN